MKFKKQISIFLGFVTFILSPGCMGANCNSYSVGSSGNAENVTFVPDKDIIIDSEDISKYLRTDEVKRLTFVPPDENSDNLLSKELFPHGSPKPEDVQQGKLGVCYFLAVLSTLAVKQPGLLKRSLVDDGKGNVIVKFFHPESGNPFYIKVRKTVPNLPGKLKFVDNDCLWVQMYLKAFIASGYGGKDGWHNHGVALKSYKLSEGGYSDLPMKMLTGKDTQKKFFSPTFDSNNAENLYDSIEKTLSDGGVAVCSFKLDADKTKLHKNSVFYEGIIRNHAYSIEELYEYSDGQKWVKLRNPWGSHIFRYGRNGRIIVDDSPESNGWFRLKFEDFISQPVRIYLSKNEKINNTPLVKPLVKIPFWLQLFVYGCDVAIITCFIAFKLLA